MKNIMKSLKQFSTGSNQYFFHKLYNRFLYRYLNADRETKSFVKNNTTVMKIFRERSKLYPNKPCFIFEGRIWTNADVS